MIIRLLFCCTNFLILLVCLWAADVSAQANRDCRVIPAYVSKSGFDTQKIYLSTSERKTMGLCLMEMPAKTGDQPRLWQHPSWKKAGWLGPMVVTEKGEIWVAPVPRVNVLNNQPMQQHWLWKTDAKTGELGKAIALPRPDTTFNQQNPFGIIGLGYDCDNGVLYVTSVAGSTLDAENGRIFALRTADMKIIGQIDSLDAFGIGIGTISGVKRCYFGAARSGNIYSIGLKPDGSFDGKPRLEFTLEGLGPRGDDRARKIRISPEETIVIQGVEFYFNLTAPTEKQESHYTLRYIPTYGRWQLISVQ